MAKQNDYFGLDRVVSLVLAIIPITSLICGILTRIKDGDYIAAIIRIFVGWNIFWILDLVFMILEKHILKLLHA